MPIQTDPPNRERQAGTERLHSEPKHHRTIRRPGTTSVRETGACPDDADLQEQPRPGRLTLVTPPAGLRYLRGRY